MSKYLVAAALIIGFWVPAFAAASPFYLMFNKATKTCFISRSAPTTGERVSMMGIYGSEYMAHRAMAGMMKCRH